MMKFSTTNVCMYMNFCMCQNTVYCTVFCVVSEMPNTPNFEFFQSPHPTPPFLPKPNDTPSQRTIEPRAVFLSNRIMKRTISIYRICNSPHTCGGVTRVTPCTPPQIQTWKLLEMKEPGRRLVPAYIMRGKGCIIIKSCMYILSLCTFGKNFFEISPQVLRFAEV